MKAGKLWRPITSLTNMSRTYFSSSLCPCPHPPQGGDHVPYHLFHRRFSISHGGCTTCIGKSFLNDLHPPLTVHSKKNALSSRNFSIDIPSKTIEPVSVENDTKIRRTIDQVVYHLQAELRRRRRIHIADIHNAIELIEQETTVGSYGTFLLNCCCDVLPNLHPSYRVTLAKRIWAVINSGKEHSSAHFEAMLKVLAINEDRTLDPFNFLDEAKNFGVNATATMYFFATLIVCQRGDLTTAVKILTIMKENMVPVNEQFFNALMIGNARAGDHKAARDILEIMKSGQIEPKINTWHTLLQLHIELGDLKHLRAEFSDSIALQLTEDQFYELLKAAGKQNHLEILDFVIQRALEFHKMHTNTVMNLILQLMYLEYGKSALKLLLEFEDILRKKDEALGKFLIKEMSSSAADVKPEVYLNLVTTLQGQNRNPYALNMAAESCLKGKKFEMAYKIFECMLSMDVPIRPHYYLPIFIGQTENNGVNGGLKVLRKMNMLHVQPNWEMLVNWIVPLLSSQEGDFSTLKAIKEVTGLSYSSSGIISAGLIVAIKENKLKEIVTFVQNIKGKLLHPELVMQSLLSYTCTQPGKNKEMTSIVTLIKYISDNKPTHDRQDYIGSFIVKLLESGKFEEARFILADISETQRPVSEPAVESIKKMIVDCNDSLTIDKNLFLEQNSNEVSSRHIPHVSEMDTFSLECHKTELESKGMNTRGTARKLFLKYCAQGDFEKAIKIKNSFEKDFGTISRGMKLALLGTYIKNEILDSALELFEELTSENDSNIDIDVYKIIDLATLMAENEKLEEAIAFVYNQCPQRNVQRPETMSRNIIKLLEALSKCNSSRVNELTHFFLKIGYIKPTNSTLGPSIRDLICKNDLTGAIELLELYAQKYSLCPCLQELTYTVLDKPLLLERLFKCSVTSKGKIEAKRLLALAKADVGDIDGSAKTLRELGNNLRFDSILSQCEYLCSRKQIGKVLNLINAIQKTGQIYDCKKLYDTAVRSCERSGYTDGLKCLISSMEENDMYIAPELKGLASQA